MQLRQLSIPDAYELTPIKREDDRGVFLEWYRFDDLEAAIGHPFALRQANLSVSKRGVVRGIHYADIPPSQAKYVTVTHGAVLDYVIDIRVGSPYFGKWEAVRLDTETHRAVYLSEGLAHAFVALTDDATVAYLVSDVYNPGAEHGINPLDPEIGLVFPEEAGELLFSEKDREAPSLAEALASGALPDWHETVKYYKSLSAGS
ncbi:dTDP-4-dehydrorhamnose 3,5-epimerase [Lacisediminihabitans sp.]|uniref:dTDP-4-dehydrorhamnose 3,5-epimerase family protein n=1 Tax=Lacisediminihabitans sp. TaxID=2787631 RepID=UPI002F9223DE